MEFLTKYDRKNVKTREEKSSPETIVETAGYLTAEQRITALFNAGQRLMDYRKSMNYDINSPEEYSEDLSPDPTRAPNFDLADASAIADGLTAVTKNKRSAVERAQAEEAAKAAEQAKKDAEELAAFRKASQTRQDASEGLSK